MKTYKLIIKNIIQPHININFFSLDYKEDETIKYYIKLSFCLFEENLNVRNKYKKLSEALDSFLLKNKQEEFIDYFYKIQKTYNTLNRFVYSYKYKKTKIVVNTDMMLNELVENDKNVICIIDKKSKYLFHVNDLIKIINTSLTNSFLFFSEPKSVKNPYNNLPFNKSTLYNIYFYIRYKTDYYPELFFKFFECNFNLSYFKFLNENLLRDYSIENYVYKSHDSVVEKDIRQMILTFNSNFIQNKILVNDEFPVNKLATIMRPYLFLYCKSLYSFHPQIKRQYTGIFNLNMLIFNKFNPQFGRKKYKIIYKPLQICKTTKYFTPPHFLVTGVPSTVQRCKKRICLEIFFDDKCINFYEYEKQNKHFSSNHLLYNDYEPDVIVNIYNENNEEDDEEYDNNGEYENNELYYDSTG